MNSVLKPKSEDFALRIVKLSQYLNGNHKEYVMSKQLLRSGTGIGANIAEAHYAQSKPDFITKMTIALKETAETVYWINLLHKAGYLNKKQFQSINNDAEELLRLLISTVKTSRANLEKKQ